MVTATETAVRAVATTTTAGRGSLRQFPRCASYTRGRRADSYETLEIELGRPVKLNLIALSPQNRIELI
mgnify:CR=1 FL=1